MQVINRKEAQSAGYVRYYTGMPCLRGHMEERSTINGCCLACARDKMAVRREAKRKPKQKSARQIAQESGHAKYITGLPCAVGHIAERRTSNGRCCVCEYEAKVRLLAERPELHRAYAKKWAKANPDKVRAAKRPCNANRRAAQMKRTPSWITDVDYMRIKVKHAEARWMTAHTGIRHAVDHIYPLQGKTVSGLHVPSNMRVIPMRENSRKHNKFVPA